MDACFLVLVVITSTSNLHISTRFFASTLVAVQAVLLGFRASNCIIFGGYVLFAFGVQRTEFSQKALAVGLLTSITVVHGVWMKAGIRIQNFWDGLRLAWFCLWR